MSFNVTFDTGDIASKAAAIQTTAGEIESQLAQLTTQMGALAETYTGPGAAAFQEVYARWQQTQGQIHAELADIGTALANTGLAREEVEGQIASQWNAAR